MHKSMITRSERTLPFSLLTLALLILPLKAGGQGTSRIAPPTKGAHEVLAIFEKNAQIGLSYAPPDIVRHPENYPRARVDSVIDGLERLALSADPQFVGSSAAAALTIAGAAESALPGIFGRVLSVYRRSSSAVVRGMILQCMYYENDRGRAIAFLKSVAAQDPANRDFDGAPFMAAMALREMAEDGRVALTDLRDKNLLRDPRTIGFVKWYLHTK